MLAHPRLFTASSAEAAAAGETSGIKIIAAGETRACVGLNIHAYSGTTKAEVLTL